MPFFCAISNLLWSSSVERYLSFTLELYVMIFSVFLDSFLQMENKSFCNSLHLSHFSDLVTTKKHSECLIISKFDFTSLVFPSDDSTNATCSFDKPENGSLMAPKYLESLYYLCKLQFLIKNYVTLICCPGLRLLENMQ